MKSRRLEVCVAGFYNFDEVKSIKRPLSLGRIDRIIINRSPFLWSCPIVASLLPCRLLSTCVKIFALNRLRKVKKLVNIGLALVFDSFACVNCGQTLRGLTYWRWLWFYFTINFNNLSWLIACSGQYFRLEKFFDVVNVVVCIWINRSKLFVCF